ncbi:mucin-2-like [Musca vetustissima]|uniref:mucin-2-like n=1 Tax=Musca vetustissima TaxID=27455 RepID=UPI002AB7ABA8|nr:mucin-2-like [Musca vetustissima]
MKNYLTAIFIFLIVNAQVDLSTSDGVPLLTQTIYGFLDFTTTIGNTVMVFSPQSAPPPTPNSKCPPPPPVTTEEPILIKTTPLETVAPKEADESTISPTKLKPSSTTTTTSTGHHEESTTKPKVTEVKTSTTTALTTTTTTTTAANVPASQVTAQEPAATTTNTATSKAKPVQLPKSVTQKSAASSSSSSSPSTTPSIIIDNVVHDPEYDLLSRQPPQYVEENYRVVSLRPNNKNSRPAVVVTPEKNTASTSSVLATRVTASTVASSSRSHKNKKHKIRSSSTLQVLKTAAPVQHPKVTASSKAPSHRSSSGSSSSSSRKSGKKGSHRTTSTTTTTPQPQEDVVIVKSSSSSSSSRNKPKRKNKNKHSSSSSSSSSTTKPRYSSSGTTTTTTEATVKRAFKPKLQISNPDLESNNNLHITKLNRTPGRWQYKTSPKPRVSIRKPNVEVNGPLGLANVSSVYPEPALADNFQNNNFLNGNGIYNQSDLDFEGSQNGAVLNNIDQEGKQKYFTETINVEISTPADFKDTYYEIATIKKPFIFQAGVLKKTRYITVTSTIEKFLTSEPSIEPRNDDEPLTENILAASEKPSSGLLMGSVITLAPIYVNNDSYTPYLETVTESFSVVNQKLKTQILPVINELHNLTSYHTLVQTIDMTSLITVVKTTSPDMETKDFHGFQDFVGNLDEAGSEINLDLEFGDENNNQESSHESGHKHHLDHLDVLGHGNKTSAAILPTLSTDPQNLFPNIITNSRPVIKLETIWDSYVVPITNGPSTFYRTLSKAKGVVEKTEYVVDTTTVPAPILPPTSLPNPFLLPQLQQFQTITSPVVQQTVVTQTESKVLKLTFGAKTAYTTLYSTHVVPTVQTTYVTTSVPVQPTANPFPGYFPPAYNPFAYLG